MSKETIRSSKWQLAVTYSEVVYEENTLIGRKADLLPGHFGDPLTVEYAQWSRHDGRANLRKPMFLLLHGWASNEEDMIGLMKYVAPYNDYVALRAPLDLPAQHKGPGPVGYTWLHDVFPSGEDLDRDAFAAATAIDRWVGDHVDGDREVVPLGFSQGGLLAVHLLRLHPERYRAAICLSGFLAPGVVAGSAPADDRLAELQLPVFFSYGGSDGVVARNEYLAMSAWLEEYTYLKLHEYPKLDHAVSLSEFSDLRQWLSDNNIASGII